MDTNRRNFMKILAGGAVGAAICRQPAAALADMLHQPRFSQEERWEIDYDLNGLNGALREAHATLDSEMRLWIRDQAGALDLIALLRGFDRFQGLKVEDSGLIRSMESAFNRGNPSYETQSFPALERLRTYVQNPEFQNLVAAAEGGDPVLEPVDLGAYIKAYDDGLRAPKARFLAGMDDSYKMSDRLSFRDGAWQKLVLEALNKDKCNPTLEAFSPLTYNGEPFPEGSDEDLVQRELFPDAKVTMIDLPNGGKMPLIESFSPTILGQHYTEGLFPYLTTLNSAGIFGRAAGRYASRFLAGGKGDITIIYPAGGDHIAPLEFALQLFEHSSVERADYIYTDVDPVLRDNLFRVANILGMNGLWDVSKPRVIAHDQGDETEFSLQYSTQGGKQKIVNVRYVRARSGEKTMRQSDMDLADVFLLHDSTWNGGPGSQPQDRLDECRRGIVKSGRKGQVILCEEDYLTGERHTKDIDFNRCSRIVNIPPFSNQIFLPGLYGCRKNNVYHPDGGDHLGGFSGAWKYNPGARMFNPMEA